MSSEIDSIFECLSEGPVRDALYDDMISVAGCGPFDGCCVAFAQALRDVVGGEIVVLFNERGQADHAAVRIAGTFIDFDGPLPQKRFIERFSENESVKIIGCRAIEDGDLVDACRDPGLIARITMVLRNSIAECSPSLACEDSDSMYCR